MRISVVIPALNEAARIAAAIRSARDNRADEILVVDGGSRDDTGLVARQEGAEVMESPPGRAQQQNEGARQAIGDVLLFLHADNQLSHGCLDQIRSTLENRPEVACGAFRQQIDRPGLKFRLLEWGNRQRVQWRGSAYGDQGIFVRREVFWQLGGFDHVPLLEDLLLMKQLRKVSPVVLLKGPLIVDARRWEKYGVVRQTLRNWWILAAHRCGRSPEQLAKYYQSR